MVVRPVVVVGLWRRLGATSQVGERLACEAGRGGSASFMQKMFIVK